MSFILTPEGYIVGFIAKSKAMLEALRAAEPQVLNGKKEDLQRAEEELRIHISLAQNFLKASRRKPSGK